MEVILTQDVERLGSVGEKVVVRGGYARNFLIPRGLAVPATSSTRAQAGAIQSARARATQMAEERAKTLAQELERRTWTISVTAGAQGLHGAVTSSDIAGLLEKEGLAIERHQIELDRPIGQLGIVEVPVRLHPHVKATLKIRVTPQTAA